MSNQTKSTPDAATSKPGSSSPGTPSTKSQGVNTNQLVESIQVCISNLVSICNNELLTKFI